MDVPEKKKGGGAKGRSGRASTLAHKQAKSDAARKRWGLPPAGSIAPGTGGKPPQELTGELRTIAEHDLHMGRPVTWGDALKRMQLVEQDIINERREVELEKSRMEFDAARGLLVERSELDRALAKLRDAWWREAQQIAGLSVARLATLPGDVRAMVKVAIESEVAASAERVKASML